ncbi:MAG: hypothetical protein WBC06_06200, partial [Chitinophagaceae bacterium]
MNFKSTELFLQVFLALLFSISNYIAVSTFPDWVPGISIIAFALVQIISLIAHTNIKMVTWKETRLRRIHLIGVGIVLLIMFFGLSKPAEDKYDMSGLGIIIYALIPAAGLAVFYIVIT